MMNIMEQLENLNDKEWNELFVHMKKEAYKSVSNRDNNLLYRYFGEIDCPKDMLHDFATIRDINNCGGKINWFLCSDGSFFTCGDCEVDALFDSGKVVDYEFPFEIERDEKYNRLSKAEKIAFRVSLQGITYEEAESIVSYEFCEWWD